MVKEKWARLVSTEKFLKRVRSGARDYSRSKEKPPFLRDRQKGDQRMSDKEKIKSIVFGSLNNVLFTTPPSFFCLLPFLQSQSNQDKKKKRMPESHATSSTTAPPAAAATATKSLWTEYTHQDGRKYYYHTVTKQTVWQKPDELKTPKEVSSQQELRWMKGESFAG